MPLFRRDRPAPVEGRPAAATVTPAPAPAAIIGKGPCDDFCSRAYCVQGTTCGPNPTTGKCGCWPDQSIPSSDI